MAPLGLRIGVGHVVLLIICTGHRHRLGGAGQILAVNTTITHDHSCLANAIAALVDLLKQIEPFE
jgi:hypothetical protein